MTRRVNVPEEGLCLRTADGREWDLSYTEGRLSIRDTRGDNLLIVPESAVNVVTLVPWPSFQPVQPPTPDVPVVVPRDLVLEVMQPRSNGVGGEAVEAVQAAVQAEPLFRSLLVSIIERTLTKRRSGQYGYETVIIRPEAMNRD